jgi:hypothetical protein
MYYSFKRFYDEGPRSRSQHIWSKYTLTLALSQARNTILLVEDFFSLSAIKIFSLLKRVNLLQK